MKRHSGRCSRERAMSSGVNASGASQACPASAKIKFGKTRMRSNALSSASAKLNSESRCFFIHQVRHVGTADQRAAENHLEADGKAVVAIGIKLSQGRSEERRVGKE